MTATRGRAPAAATLAAALVVAIAGAIAWWRGGAAAAPAEHAPPPPIGMHGEGLLLRVVDGDTVVVRYHDLPLRVRIRHLDTAESVALEAERNTRLGRDTSAWAKGHLSGKRIRLDFQRDGWAIATDRHDRALADLWIDNGPPGPDPSDALYAETAIAAGLSRYVVAWGRHPTRDAELRRAEADARAQGLGIWGGRR